LQKGLISIFVTENQISIEKFNLKKNHFVAQLGGFIEKLPVAGYYY